MPPRKRKAGDDAGPETKRSKKEQLAEARARARQWAEEEARKKAGGGNTAVAPTKKIPARSPARTAPKSTVKSPTRASVKPRSSSAAKSPRRAVESPPGRAAKRPENVSPPASTNRPPVAKRQAEARARAKAWAAKEEAKRLASKKNVRASKPTQEMPMESESDNDAVASEDENMEEPEEMETDGEDNDMEKTDEEEDAIEMVHHERNPPSSAPSTTHATALPFGSPGRPNTWKAKTVTQHTEELPPSVLENNLNREHHIEGDQHQETQEIERQIQAQVFANAMSHQPQTMQQQDVVKFMQQQQPPQYHEEAFVYPEDAGKRGRPYLTGLLTFAGIGAILAAVWYWKSETVFPISTPVVAQKLPPCFVDNYDYADTENPPESPFKCDLSLPRIPCPGRCADGRLLFCNKKYLTSASDGSRCVLSVSANATLGQVESLLTNWTTQSFCDLAGVEFARKGSKAPVFPLQKILERVEVDREILDYSPNFVVEQEDGDYFVGISDEYADTKIVLPTMCWIGLLTADFAIASATKSLAVFLSSMSTLLRFSVAYPVVSSVCLVVLLLIVFTRRRRAAQRQLLIDVANIRQLAYQRMMEDKEEHVVLHLRDEIAMDLHPTSKSSRSYLILKVWPRVVADVRLDNRIRKTNRRFGGKPRDVWQWVALASSRSVKLQSNQ